MKSLIILIVVAMILLAFKMTSLSNSKDTKSQKAPSQNEETINICDTCQGHFGDMSIGVDSTKYSNDGPTTRLWIGNKTFTVQSGQTLQVDKYVIFVEEIKVGSKVSPSGGPPPPVGGGGGLVSLRIKTDDSSRFFDLIDRFENFPNFSSGDISRILNVTLIENTRELEPYYTVKVAKGSNIAGFFKSIEFRTPKGTNEGGILIMDLNDNSTITEKDILNVYPNATAELKETTPPHTVPYDYMVKKSWGKISYQITWDGSKRVISVILDSID